MKYMICWPPQNYSGFPNIFQNTMGNISNVSTGSQSGSQWHQPAPPPNRTRCLDDSIWSKVLKLVISAENLWTPNCSKIINQPKETQAARLRESPKKQFEQRRFMTILLTPELHRDCTCLRLKCASKAKLHVETFHLSVSVSRWPSKSINIVCQIHTSAAWTPTLFN